MAYRVTFREYCKFAARRIGVLFLYVYRSGIVKYLGRYTLTATVDLAAGVFLQIHQKAALLRYFYFMGNARYSVSNFVRCIFYTCN